MPSTFGLAANLIKTTLAHAHAVSDGQLVLAAGSVAAILAGYGGTLPANRVYRVAAVANPGSASEIILGVFEATGATGDTLTGLSAVEGYADVSLASGTAIQVRDTAKYFAEMQTAVNTAESTIVTNTANIATNTANIATNTTAIATKAADNAVVHLAGTETVTGAKTFSADAVFSSTIAIGAAVNLYKMTILGASQNTVFYGVNSSAFASGDTMYFGSAGNAIVGSAYGFQYTASCSTGFICQVTNRDNANLTSDCRYEVIVGGPNGGDPKYVLTINGAVNWCAGVDNSDSDRYKISASDTPGTNDVLMFDTSGYTWLLGPRIGFFGATPVAKPTITGSRGGNAALASLLTQGAALGLWTDGTTA